jgi:1,4-alpha-glucan branching enzyme
MSLTKRYLKTKKVCKVTFRIPKKAARKAKTIYLVGEFNHWNTYATPMKRLNSGEFAITLDLETGKAYQFRYLIDDTLWENDWAADQYVPNPFGNSENSVVVV